MLLFKAANGACAKTGDRNKTMRSRYVTCNSFVTKDSRLGGTRNAQKDTCKREGNSQFRARVVGS